MSALYTHTTRASGTNLTALIYNGDHQNHIDNGIPLQQDDYSTNVVQMQSVVDPGEFGTESLATSQAGEFERLRFLIQEIKGTAQWYESNPDITSLFKAKENFLLNGDFRSWQEGTLFDDNTTPANGDDTYVADVWKFLSEGSDTFDISQNLVETDLAEGSFAGIDLQVETTGEKGGIVQFIENLDTERLYRQGNGKCSLSFSAKTSNDTDFTLIRAGVLAWSGAADVITTDVVLAWNSEGTNPSLATDWTFENTPEALDPLTTSVQQFKIENISLDTVDTTNLAVFIWMQDNTNQIDDTVTISAVKLEPGVFSTPFEGRNYQEELSRIWRFFKRDTNDDDVLAVLAGTGAFTSTTVCQIAWHYPEMRVPPAFSSSGAQGFQILSDDTFDISGGGLSADEITKFSMLLECVIVAAEPTTPGFGGVFRADGAANKFIQRDARL